MRKRLEILKDLTWAEKQKYFKERDKGFSHKGALRKAKTIHTLKGWVKEWYKMKKKETKQNEAETRQGQYEKLSVKQRIEKLDKKLGKGIGAKKERAKLSKIKKEV